MKIKTAYISILCLVTVIIIPSLVSASQQDTLDYRVNKGKFYTSEGLIPNGCFAQLMMKLNGDNIVAALYINKADLRGCITANIPYPDGNENNISYQIIKKLNNHRYHLKICEKMGGSMGNSCDKIIIQFNNREYITPEGKSNVLSLEKLGSW